MIAARRERKASWMKAFFLFELLFGLAVTQVFAQSSTESVPAARFYALDISIDSKDRPFAAYQLMCSVPGAKIVGIEGGEHTAFAQPPVYDPKAMQQDRVIIAAFSTNAVSSLPRGNTRVATIHIQTSQPVSALQVLLKLQTVADIGGNKISAEAVPAFR
jgi:hypothetical protein